MKSFGEELVRARESRSMNRAEFALVIGVTANAVKKWEENESFPVPKRWPAIKAAIGLNPQNYKERIQTRANIVRHMKEGEKGKACCIPKENDGHLILSPAQHKFFTIMKNIFTTEEEWERLLKLSLEYYSKLDNENCNRFCENGMKLCPISKRANGER